MTSLDSPRETRTKICVFGGGINGVTIASVFARLAHYDVTIVEKESNILGSVRHDQFLPQEESFQIPSFPLKQKISKDIPLSQQIQKYLEDVTRDLDIDVLTNHQVAKLVCKEKYGWYVTILNGDDNLQEKTVFFDKIIISDFNHLKSALQTSKKSSTGSDATAPIKNQKQFNGVILNDFEIQDAAFNDKLYLEGKKVAVIGFGANTLSALDVVLKSKPASVTHVFTTPRWVVPQKLGGLLSWRYFLLPRIATLLIPSWEYATTFQKYLHKYGSFIVSTFWKLYIVLFNFFILLHAFVAASWGTVRKVYTNFTFLGLLFLPINVFRNGLDGVRKVQEVLPSRHSALKQHLKNSFTVDFFGYFSAVANGEITSIQGDIHAFKEHSLVLKDSKFEFDVDVVILPSLEWTSIPELSALPQNYQTVLLKEKKFQFYRHVVNPEVPNFAFSPIASGSTNTYLHHSGLHVVVAEVAAIWLDAYWSRNLKIAEKDEILNVISAVREWKVKNIDNKDENLPLSVINSRYQTYIDLMLQDLKLNTRRKGLFVDFITKYEASDYSTLLKEYVKDRGIQLKTIKVAN